MKLYVAVDVGCHECGVGHEVLGAFWSATEAEAACNARSDENDGWRDGGQTVATVFEVDVPAPQSSKDP